LCKRPPKDADGGVTSKLGFRLIIEHDSQVRALDVATGKRYVRPREAQTEATRAGTQTKASCLEAEVERLRKRRKKKP
jgi:hypothetical protein